MRSLFTTTAILAILTLSLGAATNSPQKSKVSKPYQVGKASWYGKQFHGRITASGEQYDMFQFTAAHRQLPLGTWLKVTNMHNGRWVMVRVNDRGPVPESRIIDLSYGAAEMLFDAKDRGLLKVRLDIMPPEQVQMAQNLAGGE